MLCWRHAGEYSWHILPTHSFDGVALMLAHHVFLCILDSTFITSPLPHPCYLHCCLASALLSRLRVKLVVELGIERGQEVAGLFEGAAGALAVDINEVLAELQPMDTHLDKYTSWISKFRAAANAAVNAAPSEVCDAAVDCAVDVSCDVE